MKNGCSIMNTKEGDNFLIDIKSLQQYYLVDAVLVTQHASLRFRQRGIHMKDIRNAVMTGNIIEQYEDDTPFPSCLILGKTLLGRPLHVVMSDEGTATSIITAYIPDSTKWDTTFSIRKD